MRENIAKSFFSGGGATFLTHCTVRKKVVHGELCVWSVQAMEAEASYKACIQAANSTREQLDHVKVVLQNSGHLPCHFSRAAPMHSCLSYERNVCVCPFVCVCLSNA